MEFYTFNQHRHNYAIWTAARAVQRNFTSTSKIKYAIEQTSLQEFAESDQPFSIKEFETLHTIWAMKMQEAFQASEIKTCSYGRAAKIISIYLKTSVLLGNQGNCGRSEFIHPPIDGILLKNMSKNEGLADLKAIRWTQLSQEDYWKLVERLRTHFNRFDWRLEYYWTPELE